MLRLVTHDKCEGLRLSWAGDRCKPTVGRDMAPHVSGGIYLNYTGHEGDDWARAACGEEKYHRLATLKAEWDLANLFGATGTSSRSDRLKIAMVSG